MVLGGLDAIGKVVVHHVLVVIENIVARWIMFENKPSEQWWSRKDITVILRANQSKV